MPLAPQYRLLCARGDYAEAERQLLADLRTSAEPGPIHLDGVRLYHALSEPEQAAMHLGRAREAASRGAIAETSVKLAEAVDHLAHGDARAASECLIPLTRDGDTLLPAHERHEAWVLAAESDLALGNSFRAWKSAERAAAGPGSREQPALVTRAMLVLGRCHMAKGAADRAQEIAARAHDLAVRENLKDLLAETTAFRGEIAGAKDGNARPATGLAETCFQTAREIWERLALELEPGRRAAFLAHPRRQGAAPEARPEAAGTSAGLTRRFVATLLEMSGLINSMTDLDALLERVMDIAVGIVGAERGLIVLFDNEGDRMEVRVARNLEGPMSAGVQEFSRHVMREAANGKEVVAFDTASDERMRGQQSVLLYSIRSLVCFPLRMQEQVLGAVYLDNQRANRVYTPEDLDFLRAFTNLAAIAIQNSRLLARLKEENVYLKKVVTERFRHTNIIGSGPAMERVFHLVEKAMESSIPVMVTGETGTGKEVVTKAIHFGSARKDKSFVAQNCAAIPSELLESEMFGYKRGAFTGADQDKKGLFEIADGGTLFLDEIGELDMSLQAKLLRVLQDGTIRRVGGTGERRVDVRMIAATNRNLKEAVDAGRFRLDLYYRLNVLQIDLPPLRMRTEDIPLLAASFLEKCNKQMNRSFRGFTGEAMQALKRYPWPGNVRELENAVARAAVFADGPIIALDSLPSFLLDGADIGPRGPESAVAPRFAAAVPAFAGRIPPGTRPLSPGENAAATANPGSEPTAENAARARELLSRIDGGENFWEVVKKPFLKRDLPREVVREVVRQGLERSGWKYTRVIEALRLPPDEYRRFMNFLAKFNLKSERPADPR